MGDRDTPFIVIERSGSFTSFLWGGLIGAGIMLLLAPATGQEARRELKRSARRLREASEDALQDLQDSLTETVSDVRREVDDRVDSARRAYTTGRQAAQDTRQDLSRRLAETRSAVKRDLRPAPEPDVAPRTTSGGPPGTETGAAG
ncbi:MAG: YtxH domain-containing protein [Longimicrobiales bacterium]